MRYTLRQLHYFAATADHGSISKAARALSVSQPSISSAILQLERQYDVVLFLRQNSAGVTLTPSGEILLREARIILNHAEDFEAIATSVVNEVTGELKVATFINLAPVYMASLVRSFQNRYPRISIDLTIGNQQEVYDAIDSGKCEIGLTFDLELPAYYRRDSIATFAPQAVLSPDHSLASQDTVSLEQLTVGNFIYLDLPHSSKYFFSLFERQGLRPLQSQPVGNFETIRSFVGNGLGYSILNLKPLNQTNYDGTQVRYVPLNGSHRSLELCCISLKRDVYRRATLAFIDHVKDHFS
ncbi:MAG: LysR family transcriptional regulator [Paracoccaceae bacterium]